jgi:streptomycin 6-kinase
MNVPTAFADFMLTLHGPKGEQWVRELSERIAEYAARWSLSHIGEPFNLSYNYVAPATRADGTPVVLKFGVPHRELNTEIAALRLYNGQGICRLLEADEEAGAFLLERITPGTMLSTLFTEGSDDEATRIAADVMRRLWVPAPTDGPFPTVADWARGLERMREEYKDQPCPIPAHLAALAEEYFAELIPTQSAPVLLHGDLHHFNILRDGDTWRAIDPKGVIGEPAYEVGALLRNPFLELRSVPDVVTLTNRRLDILADELALNRERLRKWSFAQTILSAWWSIEDSGMPDDWFHHALACAEMMR